MRLREEDLHYEIHLIRRAAAPSLDVQHGRQDGEEGVKAERVEPEDAANHSCVGAACSVVLPLMSGRRIADRLRKLRPNIKVLFMSGYTDDAILQHGILNSGVAYLQKPLTPRALTSKVREVLQRKSGG